MYYVYVLKYPKTNKLYYGYTSDIQRRIIEHNKAQACELIYFEAYKSELDARKREKRLKHYAQALTALKIRLTESLKYSLGVGLVRADNLCRLRLHKLCPH